MMTHVNPPGSGRNADEPRSVTRLGPKQVLLYLCETLRVEPLAPLFLGLKRCIKVGAALHAGLEQVEGGRVRTLAGRYLLYACFQLDTLVDALPQYTSAVRVRDFIQESLGSRSSVWAGLRGVLACRELSLLERLRTVLLVWNLSSLTRAIEALLGHHARQAFFRQRLTSLVDAVVEDLNLAVQSRATLETLTPSYPAMGLSSLEILLLLQGRSLEEIAAHGRVLGRAEQLARLEDDILEVWTALERGHASDFALEREVDRRNLVLRHARNLGWTVRAALDEACRLAGEVERRLEGDLANIEDRDTATLMRRVAIFFPSFADALIGPHRITAEPGTSASSENDSRAHGRAIEVSSAWSEGATFTPKPPRRAPAPPDEPGEDGTQLGICHRP